MSPSEDQLRRALSEGLGAGPDVDGVVGRAVAYRRARRTKIASAVAVVAVVAGVGTGVGVAGRGGGHSDGSALSSRGDSTYSGKAGGGSERYASTADAEAGPIATAPGAGPPACPAAVPRIPSVATADAALFASPVAEMTVCGYLGTGAVVRDERTQQPLAKIYSGAQAVSIAAAADAGATKAAGASCGAIAASAVRSLLLLAKNTSGTALAPVLVGVGGCDRALTNGVSVRYRWEQPPALTPFLQQLQAAASAQAQVPAPSSS